MIVPEDEGTEDEGTEDEGSDEPVNEPVELGLVPPVVDGSTARVVAGADGVEVVVKLPPLPLRPDKPEEPD